MQKKTLVSACLVISGVFLVFILIILFSGHPVLMSAAPIQPLST